MSKAIPMKTRIALSDDMVETKRIGGAVTYIGKNCLKAIGWKSDRQVYPDFHYSFKSEKDRETFLLNWWEKISRKMIEKEEFKSKENPFKVGDILVYSWGYDQTNLDFYQVTQVDRRSVLIRKIGSKVVGEQSDPPALHHYVMADPGNFLDVQEMKKMVKWGYNGEPYLKMEHSIAKVWKGEKRYESWTG